MKKYLLEIGQLSPSKQTYTYMRRAQAVIYTMQWIQDSISNSIQALKDRFYEVYGNDCGISGRITEFGGSIVEKLNCD